MFPMSHLTCMQNSCITRVIWYFIILDNILTLKEFAVALSDIYKSPWKNDLWVSLKVHQNFRASFVYNIHVT